MSAASGPEPRSARAPARILTRCARARRPRERDAALERARAFAAPGRAPSILVVKLHDQLGDFLVATPAMRALRARFPASQIELLTRPYLAPLARRVAAFDRVLIVPRVSGPVTATRSLALLVGVARSRPGVVLVLNSVSRSRTADAFAALSGGQLIVGRSRVGAGPLGLDAPARAVDGAMWDPVYDLDLPCARASCHQVDRVGDLLAWLGDAPALEPLPRLDVAQGERAVGRQALEALVPDAARVIGIHPAAANPLKCWPVESFVEWGARAVARDPAARIVVVDTPKDPGPARAVLGGLRARGVEAAFLEARALDKLIAPLSALDVLACNDSGMMHVAAALGVATLSFHSLGDPAEWAPRSETAIALHAEPIAAISVEAAVAAFETLHARIVARGAARAGGV